MNFILGTHRPEWLWREAFRNIPLCVSRRTLAGRRKLHRSVTDLYLDSGGFSELSMHGSWLTPPDKYVGEVRRFSDEIGRLRWAAVQDWMCEPFILSKTGLSVGDHQQRTVDSYLRLRDMAPDLPWMPVLQGWHESDYLRHLDMYDTAGIYLQSLPVVGVGTVCRRQDTTLAASIVSQLSSPGISLHGFGIKTLGLARCAPYLTSSDSMAWSFRARRGPPLVGCTAHKNCANCPEFALAWRVKVLKSMTVSTHQLMLKLAS